MIRSRQQEYYDALGTADKQVDSAGFVELMLEIIRDSLTKVTVVGRPADQVSDQVTDQDKTPVSYTHLDVYKRQSMIISL